MVCKLFLAYRPRNKVPENLVEGAFVTNQFCEVTLRTASSVFLLCRLL